MDPLPPPPQAGPASVQALEDEIALLQRVARRQCAAVVIDDMQSMRLLMARTLKAAGFTRVLRAADGEAGLEMMERHSCDLALVDWNMPRLDGMALLGRVREHPRLAPMVFLLVTAENLDARVMRAAEESQDAFLSKPVSAENLARRLGLVLTRRLTSARAALREALGRPERAAEEFLVAMANQPRLLWPLMGLGELMARQGRLAEAERCFERALALEPRALGALLGKARLRESQGQIDQARLIYAEAVAAGPLFFRARDALADSLVRAGRPEEALEELEQALVMGGGENADRQERVGALAYDLGRYGRAQEALAKALELKPQRHAAANNLLLASALLAQSEQDPAKLEEALPCLERAAQAAAQGGDHRGLADALLLAAATHLRRDDQEGARLVFTRLGQDQTWPGGQRPFAPARLERELLAVCLAAGCETEAKRRLAVSLTLAPGDAENIEALRRLCAEAGRPELFGEVRDQREAWLRAEVEACSRLGLALVLEGRFDQARAQYQRGLELDPDSGRLRYNLAKLHLRQGQEREALPSLAAAAELALAARDWELLAQTAGLLAELGHVPQARALLDQARAWAPDEVLLAKAREALPPED